MITAVEAIYQNGQIILQDPPAMAENTKVLVIFLPVTETAPTGKKIRIGSLKGKIHVPEDFNEPLDDLKDYMY